MARGFLAALVILTSFTLTSAAPAGAAAGTEELDFLAQTNAVRAQNGLGALQWDEAMANVARGWSSQMAAAQSLSHNGNLVSQVNQFVTNQWTRLGENVGFGPTVSALQGAFMNSSPHRANITGDYNRVGIGVVRDGSGTIWVTLDFLNGPSLQQAAPAPDLAPAPPGTPMWYLRNSLTTGVADSQFPMGIGGDKVMACDWNGDGIETPGIFRDGIWYITDQLGSGGVHSFGFGVPGDIPVCGDWNGDRTDTPGVYRDGVFYLRNSNTTGVADLAFPYGSPGDLPAVGDWNGDGIATVGVYRSGMYYLRNTNTGGFADLSFAYGDPGDRPLTGDWNGDRTDTIGIWRNGALYLKNVNTTGVADYVFGYGDPGDAPIIGDWNHNGTDKLGVVRGGV